MTHEKARAWIKRLPEGRGKPLDAGAKSVLQELWDRVDWSITSDVPASECFVSRERIAREINCPVETVKSRLTALAAAGWIRREREGWALAWERPWPVDPGASKPRPRGTQAPTPGHPSPEPGAPKPRIPSPNQVPNQVSDLPTPPSALYAMSPTQGSGSPTQAEQTAQGHPRKTRVRRSVTHAAQPGLDLGDAGPTDIEAELLAEHQRLHAAALAHHGERSPAWPRPSTADAQTIGKGIRQALRERGEAWCRRMLEWRSTTWLADATELRHSTVNVWRGVGLRIAAERMSQPARASPGRGKIERPAATGPIPRFTGA